MTPGQSRATRRPQRRSPRAADAGPPGPRVGGPGGRRVARGLVATAGPTGEVRLWNPDGSPAGRCAGHAGASWPWPSPRTARALATAGYDGAVRLWDVPAGKLRHTLPGHGEAASGVAFAPDGKRMATAGWDGRVRLWDADTGRPLWTADAHRGRAWGVAFAPDGRTVASAGGDQKVRVWDAATGTAKAAVRRPPGRGLRRRVQPGRPDPRGRRRQHGPAARLAHRPRARPGRRADGPPSPGSPSPRPGTRWPRPATAGPSGSTSWRPGRSGSRSTPRGKSPGWRSRRTAGRWSPPGPTAPWSSGTCRLWPGPRRRRGTTWSGPTRPRRSGRSTPWPPTRTNGALLAERLRADPDLETQIARRIADLDHARYAVRERATRDLRAIGPEAVPSLRAARPGGRRRGPAAAGRLLADPGRSARGRPGPRGRGAGTDRFARGPGRAEGPGRPEGRDARPPGGRRRPRPARPSGRESVIARPFDRKPPRPTPEVRDVRLPCRPSPRPRRRWLWPSACAGRRLAGTSPGRRPRWTFDEAWSGSPSTRRTRTCNTSSSSSAAARAGGGGGRGRGARRRRPGLFGGDAGRRQPGRPVQHLHRGPGDSGEPATRHHARRAAGRNRPARPPARRPGRARRRSRPSRRPPARSRSRSWPARPSRATRGRRCSAGKTPDVGAARRVRAGGLLLRRVPLRRQAQRGHSAPANCGAATCSPRPSARPGRSRPPSGSRSNSASPGCPPRPLDRLGVEGVAVTGSDLFLAEGSDVTLLVQSKTVPRPASAGRRAEAPGGKREDGKHLGVAYTHLATADGAVNVYAASPRPDLHVREQLAAGLPARARSVAGKTADGKPASGSASPPSSTTSAR